MPFTLKNKELHAKLDEISVRMNAYMALCYCRQILMDIDSKNYQASKTKSIISLIRSHLDRIEYEISNKENKH